LFWHSGLRRSELTPVTPWRNAAVRPSTIRSGPTSDKRTTSLRSGRSVCSRRIQRAHRTNGIESQTLAAFCLLLAGRHVRRTRRSFRQFRRPRIARARRLEGAGHGHLGREGRARRLCAQTYPKFLFGAGLGWHIRDYRGRKLVQDAGSTGSLIGLVAEELIVEQADDALRFQLGPNCRAALVHWSGDQFRARFVIR
jgi:hypothetical protein